MVLTMTNKDRKHSMKMKTEAQIRAKIADAILALPLDVPSDEEIAEKIQAFRKNKLNGYGNMSIGRLQLGELEWMKLVLEVTSWMRDEIIKRNK